MTGEISVSKTLNGSRWVRCPICAAKTRIKVYPDTILFNFPLFCPKCKQETRIDVMFLQMAEVNKL